MTYSLVNAPSGASIDPVSGAFAWTPRRPRRARSFWVKATDNGTPSASASPPVSVTVTPPPPDLIETTVSTRRRSSCPAGRST